MGLNELEYYANMLDIIVNLLNNSDNTELQEYLLNKYNMYYGKYEKLRIKEYKKKWGKQKANILLNGLDINYFVTGQGKLKVTLIH